MNLHADPEKTRRAQTKIGLDAAIQEFCAIARDHIGEIETHDVPVTISDRDKTITIMAPPAWSNTAVTVLATKYARRAGVPSTTEPDPELKPGEENIPERFRRHRPAAGAVYGGETSASQIFHRLAGTWTYWLCRSVDTEGRPLITAATADAYYETMVALLRSQIFAPNSPQWFNTGLYWAYGLAGNSSGHFHISPITGEIEASDSAYEYPQAHACFINKIVDSLTDQAGIMDMWSREARIFKMGSGSGANFSALRGANEKLSGGGKSSGLMSFLKVGDVSAGAIKSGGTTRRAAKMVIVDADHPDVMDFIVWKSREEGKVAALITGSRINKHHLTAIYQAARANKDVTDLSKQARRDGVEPGVIKQVIMLAQQGEEFEPEVFDADWQGEAYQTVAGQNANNTVRVTDDFMRAVEDDDDWNLIARTTDKIVKTVKARDLWRLIARHAWQSADPGLQYHTTINAWNTAANTAEIRGSNPCSEYMFLDDTGCNLASSRLTAFLRKDYSFNFDALAATSALMALTLDTTVSMGQYPSIEIGIGTRDFRTLGGGFADIGGLLMRLALPYDSTRGRALAGAIASIITGAGYHMSGLLAKAAGPFPGFAANAEPMRKVMRKHRDAHLELADFAADLRQDADEPHRIHADTIIADGLEVGDFFWDKAVAHEDHGWRNAQMSVVAPTGTIGLVMDCDTTGIEPDYALRKWKSLAGGGGMFLVNTAVPETLARLGYSEDAIKAINTYIDENQTMDGCPLVRDEHRPIFDCATPGGKIGTRAIAPIGHIEMMARVQPFISGAISKTVNMPSTATVEDIEDIHMAAWKKGIKAIAVYRDGSKLSQPLNSAAIEELGGDLEAIEDAVISRDPQKLAAELVRMELARRKLPAKRRGYTQKAVIGDHKIFLRTGEYHNGRLGEIFIDMHKEGSTIRAMMNNFAIAISIGLQHGVPLEEYVDAYCFTRFEPAGFVVGHDNLKNATSILDFIFRDLAINYLGRHDLAHVAPEENSNISIGAGHNEGILVDAANSLDLLFAAKQISTSAVKDDSRNEAKRLGFTGDICQNPNCLSTRMINNGKCLMCLDCQSTTGCS